MKIKQLKEKTIKGFVDFLPKIGINNIEGLLNALNDKLSKSEGGEVNKHIVVTDKYSEYSLTINPNGSVYIWSKKDARNIFSITSFVNNIFIKGDNINISNISSLSATEPIYSDYNDTFTASKFKLRNGNNNQILLGDGSTTSKLVSYISASPQFDAYIVNILNIDGAHDSFTISGVTKELAGLMTPADKTKLDDIPNIYAEKDEALNNIEISQATGDGFDEGVTLLMRYAKPGVAGRMAVIDNATATKDGCMSHEDKKALDNIPNTYLPSQNGNIYSNYDTDNGNTTLDVTGNYNEEGSGGKIRLKRTEDGKGELSIMLDGGESSVNAEKFSSIISPNKNEVWSTDGGRINILNLLSNAAIYVEGDTVKINSDLLISNETITDPDYIMFEENAGMFIASKNHSYFKNWNISKKRTIGNPIRYGTIIGTSVYPFHNQMYRFRNNTIVIANCSGDKPVFNKLTL